MLDCVLELFDIFGTTFSKGSLGLPVPLFPLFRGRIYLACSSASLANKDSTHVSKSINLLAFFRLSSSGLDQSLEWEDLYQSL